MNNFLNKIIQNFDEKNSEIFANVVVHNQVHDLTWGDLKSECHKVVANLQRTVDTQGVVLIFLPHGVELYPCFLGCMLAGFTPSFMPCPSGKQDPALYWSSHQELIDVIRPVAIITNKATADQMEEAGLDLSSTRLLLTEKFENSYAEFTLNSNEAIALLQHSSGTTGLKKGVALSYEALAKHSTSYGKTLSLGAQDKIVSWLPLYHDMGLIACLITPLYHGITTVQLGAFDWLGRPSKLFDLIKQYQGTLCWMPNFAFDHLSNTIGKYAKKFDLSSMRAFISCSEVCHAQTFDRFADTFQQSNVSTRQLQVCYAMAETVFAVTQSSLSDDVQRICINKESMDNDQIIEDSTPGKSIELLSCGKIVEGLDVKIVNNAKIPVSEMTIGEIAISGDYLFSGYNKDQERTQKVLKNNWYYTNDMGFIKNNELFVLGRKDDLIIVNGRNLYANQIESIVSNIDGIKKGRSVAFGVYDEKVGSDTLVIIAELASNDVETGIIIKNIIGNIQSKIDVVPSVVDLKPQGTLIKTSSGKMSRKENKKRYLDNSLDQVLQEAV